MSFTRAQMLAAGAKGREGDPSHFEVAADYFLGQGDADTALIALDRAHGLDPGNAGLAARRSELLERFTVIEHGLVFRYVPAGTFLMGSTTGDPDERPVHPVQLEGYWLSEVPLSWASFARLWELNPTTDHYSRIVNLYCGIGRELSAAMQDPDAFAALVEKYELGDGKQGALMWDLKPMVLNDWRRALATGDKLSSPGFSFGLPSEAQWEKGARGGLIGRRYPWGDALPTPETCDVERFNEFEIAPSKTFAPNGYGLYAMAGGVWEWTSSVYDALAYANGERATINPELYERTWRDPDPSPDEPHQQVLRGGSWADAAASATVSFRNARRSHAESECPNIGFRLARWRSGA